MVGEKGFGDSRWTGGGQQSLLTQVARLGFWLHNKDFRLDALEPPYFLNQRWLHIWIYPAWWPKISYHLFSPISPQGVFKGARLSSFGEQTVERSHRAVWGDIFWIPRTLNVEEVNRPRRRLQPVKSHADKPPATRVGYRQIIIASSFYHMVIKPASNQHHNLTNFVGNII